MNSFGRVFRVSLWGESHGPTLGVVIDGCPPGIPLNESDFSKDLLRRKSGAVGTTKRLERDLPKLESGIFRGRTTGGPITIRFENENAATADYGRFLATPRPGHADFVALKKFGGFADYRGGGFFSGRLTLGLVAAGIVAKKIVSPMKIESSIESIGGVKSYEKAIEKALKDQDSLGGIVSCCVEKIPVGLGEPFFDSVESLLAHAMFSIPGIKGIEFGRGFAAASMRGSAFNDPIVDAKGKTATNNCGGINGGISNGNSIEFRVAVRPAASIGREQKSYNLKKGKIETLRIEGRHDAAIALRIPPVLEAMTAIVLADLMMIAK